LSNVHVFSEVNSPTFMFSGILRTTKEAA